MWADLGLTLLAGHRRDSYRGHDFGLPNLFTVVTVPERRIFARFTGARKVQ